MKLKDKVILITGGTSGIGLETALMAKDRGAKVIINGRNSEKLAQLEKDHGFKSIKCDVSSEEEVTKMFKIIKSEFGSLDVLINNAGYGYFSLIEDIDKQKFIDNLNVNVVGAALVAKEATKMFKEQNSGNIINIASTAATKGFEYGSSYVATKFALRGMTECWRAELRKYNVRVILINPSEVQTDFGKNAGFEKPKINDTKLFSEDIAHAIISTLEMNDRGFTTELTVFATNPK